MHEDSEGRPRSGLITFDHRIVGEEWTLRMKTAKGGQDPCS